VLEQYFLRRPGEERPMLLALAERLREASAIVTYNGKSFDWPLLRSRFVMNRLALPDAPPHLDLLHCARRVFRHRGAGSRLVEVETAVMGHIRRGDIPGSLIPQLYFAYVRGRSEALMHRVLDHNVHDLLLLAALLGHLAALLDGRVALLDPRDAVGCAEVAFRARNLGRAAGLARAALASGASGALASEAWLLIARALWRARDPRGTAEALSHALKTALGARAAALHLALAKVYEHGLRDAAAALPHAQAGAAAEPEALHARRLARLDRKVARSTAPAGGL
jgi:uncharacterized protein